MMNLKFLNLKQFAHAYTYWSKDSTYENKKLLKCL